LEETRHSDTAAKRTRIYAALKTVSPEEMPELVQVAVALYEQDRGQAEQLRATLDAAEEMGVPAEYLERAAILRRARRRERNGSKRRWAIRFAAAVGATLILWVGSPVIYRLTPVSIAPLPTSRVHPLTTPRPTALPGTAGFVQQASYTGDPRGRPAGSVCISYDDGYRWLVYDSVMGWSKASTSRGETIQVAQGYRADYHHILGTRSVRRVPQ
jgi:hypothetical protein